MRKENFEFGCVVKGGGSGIEMFRAEIMAGGEIGRHHDQENKIAEKCY
jgi:hypothetical protein